MRAATDPELVILVRQGSTDAIGELFRRHWQSTWQVAFGICGRAALADDMAQDAFERAIGGLAKFNGQSSFGTWVQRIVVNRTGRRPFGQKSLMEKGFLRSVRPTVIDN